MNIVEQVQNMQEELETLRAYREKILERKRRANARLQEKTPEYHKIKMRELRERRTAEAAAAGIQPKPRGRPKKEKEEQ